MRKAIKGFIIGVIVTMLATSSVLADGDYQSIDVLGDFANFEVNGEKVKGDNFVHDGVTYIPIREAAEIVDIKVGWDDSSRTISLNNKKEKSISSLKLSNTNIKNHLDKVLFENNGIEILYGEFLNSDKFAYLSRINDKLFLNILIEEKDESKVVSKEVSNGGLEIGVVSLEGNSSKSFYTLDNGDGYLFGKSYTFDNNKITEKSFSKAHADIKENDKIYRFISPENFGGTKHNFFGLVNNEYVVNNTLLDLMGIGVAGSIRYGYDLYTITNDIIVGSTSLEDFIAKNGEPQNKNIEFDDFFGGNTYTLIYEFGEAFFIPSYTDKNEFWLAGLNIKKNSFLIGPRNISIGDSVESVLEKFHSEAIESVYSEENKKVVYSSQDNIDIEYIVYDDSENIIEISFVRDIETGGAFSFTVKFKKDKVYEIDIFQGYL